MASIDNLSSNYYIRYQLEFEDWVVENKPQFDGRFFVKVETDDILRSNLLNEEAGGYVSAGIYNVAYIANKQTNPAEDSATFSGEQESFSWPSDENPFSSVNIETSFAGSSSSDNALTEAFWNWWGDTDQGVRETTMFVDNTPTYSNYAESVIPNVQSQIVGIDGDVITYNLQESFLQNGYSLEELLSELQGDITQPSGFLGRGNWDITDPTNPVLMNYGDTITLKQK